MTSKITNEKSLHYLRRSFLATQNIYLCVCVCEKKKEKKKKVLGFQISGAVDGLWVLSQFIYLFFGAGEINIINENQSTSKKKKSFKSKEFN